MALSVRFRKQNEWAQGTDQGVVLDRALGSRKLLNCHPHIRMSMQIWVFAESLG